VHFPDKKRLGREFGEAGRHTQPVVVRFGADTRVAIDFTD
jgi:hypothetical protein